jgi:hypothetical protein
MYASILPTAGCFITLTALFGSGIWADIPGKLYYFEAAHALHGISRSMLRTILVQLYEHVTVANCRRTAAPCVCLRPDGNTVPVSLLTLLVVISIQ